MDTFNISSTTFLSRLDNNIAIDWNIGVVSKLSENCQDRLEVTIDLTNSQFSGFDCMFNSQEFLDNCLISIAIKDLRNLLLLQETLENVSKHMKSGFQDFHEFDKT